MAHGRFRTTGPKFLESFSCSSQLSMKLTRLINVKMPIVVGILSFISMINTTSESLTARKVFIFQHFRFYEHWFILNYLGFQVFIPRH